MGAHRRDPPPTVRSFTVARAAGISTTHHAAAAASMSTISHLGEAGPPLAAWKSLRLLCSWATARLSPFAASLKIGPRYDQRRLPTSALQLPTMASPMIAVAHTVPAGTGRCRRCSNSAPTVRKPTVNQPVR